MSQVTSIQIEAIRADLPANSMQVFLNNAGSSMPPKSVFNVMKAHLEQEALYGLYEAEYNVQPQLADMYDQIATLIGAKSHEIAWAENCTRGWEYAFYSIPLSAGDRIITHASEYNSNFIAFLHKARHAGIEIDVAPCDSYGRIDIDKLPELVTSRTKLISLTYVPTQGGHVNNAIAVGEFARTYGLLYLLDACNAVGQIEVDVHKIGCDLLVATGRKFLRGPRGSGFMYVSERIADQLEPVFADSISSHWDGGSEFKWAGAAGRFETAESCIAARLGLAEAARYANAVGIRNIEQRVTSLANRLRSALETSPHISVIEGAPQIGSLVTFISEKLSNESLVTKIQNSGYSIYLVKRRDAIIDYKMRGIEDAIRISPHYFNTEDEIDDIINCLYKYNN